MSGSFKTGEEDQTYAAPMTTKFAVVAVVVGDMGRSLAFYRKLGLDVPADADDQPHVEATLPGGLRLAWDTTETILSFDSTSSPLTGGRGVSLAFACDDAADVNSTYADLVKAGYEGHLEPWDAVWGQRYAAVHDPDGNTVDLFAAL